MFAVRTEWIKFNLNYYETLGVDRNATPEEIKKAHRKLASKFHPDRKGGDTAKFQEIQQAYETLMDDRKRAEYDAMRSGNFGGNPNIDDVFKSFGFSFGESDIFSQFMRGQRRNPDIKTSIEINLADTLSDTTKIVTIKTKNNENKTLEIKIPRGIKSGTVMKFSGGGETIFPNAHPGDLYINIIVHESSKFTQHGLDLETEISLNCFDAILGCELEVQTLSEKTFVMRVPPNTQQGTKFKIPGEGLYEFQKDIKGNFYVKVNIVIPTTLSTSQIELLKQIKTST
jgi:DnaJ-class molecular chaperone